LRLESGRSAASKDNKGACYGRCSAVRVWKQAKTERFLCRHLERIPLATSYPLQIEYVKNLLSRDPLNKGVA
jgi:hypothetical protein